MSAPQQTPSGQGTPTSPKSPKSPPTTQDVHSSTPDADRQRQDAELQRRVADCPEPASSVLSQVENEQLEYGSIRDIVAKNARLENPNNSRLNIEGCTCVRDAFGRKVCPCRYCSDPTLYGVIARAFDRRPPTKILPEIKPRGQRVQATPVRSHENADMNLYEGLFLSPPPLMPSPSPYRNLPVFEFNHVANNFQRNNFNANPGIQIAQNQRINREAPDLDEENDDENQEQNEEENEEEDEENDEEEDDDDEEEEEEDDDEEEEEDDDDDEEEDDEEEDEEESQLPSMPGYSEDIFILIEPPVAQTTYTIPDGQISDCYRCDRPNSWENMVACDSNHGSRERWFHISCAGLTVDTVPSGDEQWWCEDCTTSDVPDENDNTLYRDDTEESTDSRYQGGSGKTYKGKQMKASTTTEPTSFGDNYESDDITGSNRTRKRKRDQELEFMQDSTSSEGDDSDDSVYVSNSGKNRRRHEPKAKQMSGPSKGPAHHQNTPATSGLAISKSIASATPSGAPQPSGPAVPKSIATTMPAEAPQPRNRSQATDKFPPQTADKVFELMQEVIAEKLFTEKKFQTISERLAERYDIEASAGAIKNYWNRKGRITYRLDERKRPNPDKMVTGVQSPEDRRKARQQSKANDQPGASANGSKRQKRE